MEDITDWLIAREESIEFKRSDSKMNCTEKEQETCNVEKYGCEGCYYEDEEIKVGEYVRTDKGYIIKIDKNATIFNLGYEEQYIDMETTEYGFTLEEKIVKHSKQLIDLVEVGDIVRTRTGLYSSFMEFIDNEECLLILKEQVKKFWTIKEILTKEVFERNCYKVGGE